MNKKFLTVLALFVLICLAGVYLFSHTPNTLQTYKIGFIGPMTGDGAVYGEPLQRVAELAISEINASGGIGGKKIEGIFEDGKCSGEAGATAAQKLVNVDRVQAIIGGICSNESLSALPIAEAAHVALLSPSSNSTDLSGKSPFFFRIYPTVSAEGEVLASVAFQNGKRKVGFISEQDVFTDGVSNAFENSFSKLGGTVVSESFAPGTKDFKSHLAKLQAESPDALFINPLNPGTGDIILGQLRTLGWKPQIIINDPITGDSKTILKNKDLLEGAWATEFTVDPSNQKFAHLAQAYKEKYVTDVPYASFAQTEYDAIYLMKDAISAVGYDGQKIAAWGHQVKDWQGASGLITIDQKGDRVGGPKAEIIKNGQLQAF